MPETRHFTVTGRVQGVGFRAATQRQAGSLGLTGWVRNRSDGGVEVVACGDTQPLDSLQAWLAQGPTLARVDDLACDRIDGSADGCPEAFEIR